MAMHLQDMPYSGRATPRAPQRHRYEIDNFRGCDFEHNPTDVDISRSPFSLNMIRLSRVATVGDDTTAGDASQDVGAVRKRMGYHKLNGAAINGSVDMGFEFNGDMFVQARNRIYVYKEPSTTITPNQPQENPTPTESSPIYGVTFDLNGVSTTVYGGSLAYDNDQNAWVLTVTQVCEELNGQESWSLVNSPRHFVLDISTVNWAESSISPSADNCLSSHFEYAASAGPWGGFLIQSSSLSFGDTGSSMADVAALQAWLAQEASDETPVQICYTLKTPIDYTLSDEDYNNLITAMQFIEVGGVLSGATGCSAQPLGDLCFIADGGAARLLSPDPGMDSGYRIDILGTTDTDEGGAYIPTVLINSPPEGGGTAYEDYNLVCRGFTVGFYVSDDNASATLFKLPNQNLQSVSTVEVMDEHGEWQEQTAGTDYTFSLTDGTVTFLAGHEPGASPLTGADNVRVTAFLGNTQYYPMRDKIWKCNTTILYGVGGVADRVFVTGNPDYPNQDWWSAQHDPTYFPDMNYSVLGDDKEPITGYSIVNEKLIAHKKNSLDGRNAYVRVGQLIDGKAEFPVTQALMGEGAVAPKGFAFLRTEPLFVTARGVFAITPNDVLGERYSQVRSAYINGRLLRAPGGLSGARAVVYRDLYLLFVGQRVYVLDGLQKSYIKDEPYSSFQYEGYYWTLASGLGESETVTAVWVYGERLYFGTSTGNVYRFYADPDDPKSYSDNGGIIDAIWDTPYLSGSVRYNRKTFLYAAATLQAYPATSLRLWATKYGDRQELFNDGAGARYFDFNYVDFSNFTFSTDTTQVLVGHKVNLRYVDKAMFRFQNAKLNEPFVLYDATIEYIETGKLKR